MKLIFSLGLLLILQPACSPAPSLDSKTDAGGDSGLDSGIFVPHSKITIQPADLGTAIVGVAFLENLQASGGKQPYLWQLISPGNRFTWLILDQKSPAVNARLWGTPTKEESGSIEVSVTDSDGLLVSKKYALTVKSCANDVVLDCKSIYAGICITGTQTCTSGSLGACVGEPSKSANQCGPDCKACDSVAADRCLAGTACMCGNNPLCNEGFTCCDGGQCKDLNSVNSCGGCDLNCVDAKATNISTTCSNGKCQYDCEEGYKHCELSGLTYVSQQPVKGVSCETHTSVDVKNCGACKNDCESKVGADARSTVSSIKCEYGQCKIECQPGRLHCNADWALGCETQADILNCGTCGEKCTSGASASHQCVATTAESDGYQCQVKCNANRAHCVNGVNVTPTNGENCETDITTISNCGRCGIQCGAHQSCYTGACVCDPTKCGASNSGMVCLPDGQCRCTSTSCGPDRKCLPDGTCGCSASTCSDGCCTLYGTTGRCLVGVYATASACGKR